MTKKDVSGSFSDSNSDDSSTIRIGVSACIAGHRVRYDGSDRKNAFVMRALARHAELVPFCPEAGAGLGVPREPVRQVDHGQGLKILGSRSGEDRTEALEDYSRLLASRLAEEDQLCGFVVQSRSPSCGLERVRVYDSNGIPHKRGVGVFTKELMRQMPYLPIEEDGRLCDPALRDAFLCAVFTLARWRRLLASGITRGQLVDFHTNNKYLLLAHSPRHYSTLGRVVAQQKDVGMEQTLDTYEIGMMDAMRQRVSRGRHINTMLHMAGHLSRTISERARREIFECIDEYKEGTSPRGVPLALLRSHAREHDVTYLTRQTYLSPYPRHLRPNVTYA